MLHGGDHEECTAAQWFCPCEVQVLKPLGLANSMEALRARMLTIAVLLLKFSLSQHYVNNVYGFILSLVYNLIELFSGASTNPPFGRAIV